MAVCYILEWKGGDQRQYEAVLAELGIDRFDGPAADGAVVHVAGPIEGGWRVVDVWESDDAFQRFLVDRLSPATAKVTAKDDAEATITTFPVHAYFTGGGKVN